MGPPMIIGAGLGALTSVAMGKSPFTGALLGGATGGLFGGSSGLLSGFQGVSSVAPSIGSGGYAALGSQAFTPALSSVPAGVVGTTGEMGSSLLQSVNPITNQLTNAGAIPLTGLDKAMGAINKFTAPIENWSSQNPMLSSIGTGLAKQEGMDLINQKTQPIQPVQGQIRQGNPNPSSPVFKVAPNITVSGLKDMMAHTPYTEEELMRLQQLGYRG